MAIESTFLPANGPFMGVSCLPWRWNSNGTRSPMAINTDCSRGTIRGRDGFVTIARISRDVASASIKPEVLGLHAFKSKSNISLIAVLLWENRDTNNFRTLFGVMTIDGSWVDASMPIDLGKIPHGQKPDPYGYATFLPLGDGFIFTTPSGRVMKYDYDYDPSKPKVLTVGDTSPLPDDKLDIPYLDVIPRASVVHNYGGFTMYAGLDPDQWVSYSTVIPVSQTMMPGWMLSDIRSAGTYAPNIILHSRMGEPTNISSMSWIDVGAGQVITGMASTNSGLLVLTETDSFLTSTTDGVHWSLSMAAQGVGCINSRTITSGGGATAWMGANGFYMHDGGGVRKISDDIDDMFQQTGWQITPAIASCLNGVDQVPFPLRIARSQLRHAVGGFNDKMHAFIWSVPMDGSSYTDIDFPARIVLVYMPQMDSWMIWAGAPTRNSALEPTAFTSIVDKGKYRFIFGDIEGGISAFGEDTADRDKTGTGASGDTRIGINWTWQSPPMELDPNSTGSVRSIRTRQKSTGAAPTVKTAHWFVEGERAFDEADGDFYAAAALESCPSEAPPVLTTPKHLWGQGTWETTSWRGTAAWRQRYSVSGDVVGQAFTVGFYDTSSAQRLQQHEIHSFTLEVQPKRDIT